MNTNQGDQLKSLLFFIICIGLFKSSHKSIFKGHVFVDTLVYETGSSDDKPSNISKEQFDEIIAIAQNVYDEIIEEENLKPLKITGYWDSTVVNAYMNEQYQINLVSISGALARRPEISPEGLALIVCHEIGHAYGGKPERRAPLFLASVEGQADYYGAGVCLEKVLKYMASSDQYLVTDYMRRSCQKGERPEVCEQILVSGQSAGNFLANLKEEPLPDYETPDETRVRRTLRSYPKKVQCRLDTYFNAALDLERPRCWFRR